MTPICLVITSGGGPMECRLGVGHILRRMRAEAEVLGLDLSASTADEAPASAVVLLEGACADTFARNWIGTIQWRQHSALRPQHRRANWFIGVFLLPAPNGEIPKIPLAEVKFSTFRAGGPGGQHQNTTDSAVRAMWRQFTSISRDERSQHRNKTRAFERLQTLVQVAAAEDRALAAKDAHHLHRVVVRGNPLRSFMGAEFDERRLGG